MGFGREKRQIVAAVAAAAVLGGGDAASAATTTFTTPGQHIYTVPAGATRVDVIAVGGEGAANGGDPAGRPPRHGGLGAKVIGTLDVQPGQTLYAVVGSSASGTTPGFNGGGAAGGTGAQCPTTPGAGGGASDVRTVPLGQPGSAESRVLVAGGGGGAATFGEDGGDLTAYNILAGANRGRGGFPAARGGQGGFDGDPGFGGGGGSAGSGGEGTATTGGVGGAGILNGCGGGGGGGYGGGGGGGAGTSGSPGGGGGGGGSLVPEGRWPGIAGPGEPTSVTFITPGTPKPAGPLGITTTQTFQHNDQGGGSPDFVNCPDTCAWTSFTGTDGGRAPGSVATETLSRMQGWGSSNLTNYYFTQSYVGVKPPVAGHPADVGEPFLLSDFAHLNTLIRGDSPTALALQTIVRAQPPAGDVAEFRLLGPNSVRLDFLETDNQPTVAECDPAIQVSPEPCDDRWSLVDASVTETVVANGVTWHFEVLGWRTEAGTFEKRFVTRERYVNHRGLYGRITVDTNATTSVLSVDGTAPATPELTMITTPVPQTGGTVTFTDNGAPIPGCTDAPVGATDGVTTCTPAGLSAGTHALGAGFNGGVGYGPSDAALVTHVVPASEPPGGGTPPIGEAPAKLALTMKPKKRTTEPGTKVRFRAIVANAGNEAAEGVEVCAKLPKRAKGEVKVGGCKEVGVVGGGGSAKAVFKVKATDDAHGRYSIRVAATGTNAGGSGATAKLKIAL